MNGKRKKKKERPQHKSHHEPLVILRGAGKGEGGEGDVRSLGGVQASSADVVGEHGSDDTESTTSLVDDSLASEFSSGEQDEGDEQEEEHRGEHDGGLVGGEEHDEGEDEPGDQVDSQSASELIRLALVSSQDTAGWPEDQSERNPEATIGREGGSTEGVAGSELPHTSEKLAQSSHTDCHTDNNIWCGDAPSAHVIEGKDQSGGGEREETQWCGVAKLAVVDGESGLAVGEGGLEGLALNVAGTVGWLLDVRHGFEVV
jgi:hypothetical protein